MLRPPSRRVTAAVLTLLLATVAAARAEARVAFEGDVLTFGDAESEKRHQLDPGRSEIMNGGLETSSRRMLPMEPPTWEGGRLAFSMAVDPDRQNYFTARFWGSERGSNQGRLVLFIEGKQVGYRHLGDIDLLNVAEDQPAYNGRFYYVTTPLPLAMTRGKTSVALEIRSTGSIWGYGNTWAQYQKVLEKPSRAVYRAYTHTAPGFVPPADEKQGAAPAAAPVRAAPGEEVLGKIRERVNGEVEALLERPDDKPLNQSEARLIARAYHAKWTAAYQKPIVVEKVIAAVDNMVSGKVKIGAEPNPEWVAFGTAADAVVHLAQQVKPRLAEPIAGGGEGWAKVARRKGWSMLFRTGLDELRTHRRQYTNQSMILDLNAYLSNRALQVVDEANALPEPQALRYLHESIGVEPWLGSDTPTGPEKPLGENHFLVTRKGLSKELGYVGNYGEILDWVAHILRATQIGGRPGDEKIKRQLVKLARARSYFRYPALDSDGNRAMRLETVVGWRDSYYPGEVVYGERSAWEGSASYSAAATRDPHEVGFVRQMLADNQYFKSLEGLLKDRGIRVTTSLLGVPEQYETIKASPPTPHKLPMSPGEPDFVWADEEDGVVAVKNGDEILYVSLYWRARYGINNLARVHHVAPAYDRIATIAQQTEFEPSGKVYERPDWVNMGFGNGGHKYPGDLHSAHAGERLPIAASPPGVPPARPGQETPYAGKGSFYACRYGNYLIGMNCTGEKSYRLEVPAEWKRAVDLASGQSVEAGASIEVKPQSTVVLHMK